MRIIFVSVMAIAPWGGSEELWSRAAARLRGEGHEVSASVVWWPKLSEHVARLEKQGIEIATHANPPAGFVTRMGRRIKRRLGAATPEVAWLRAKRPDLVVVSQGYNRDGLDWLRFCREAGVPSATVIQCNSESWWPTDEIGGEMALAYRSAKKVFCVSHHNLRVLEYQIGETLPNGAVVWNPINVTPSAQNEWPKDNRVWKLACVARLEPAAKGQDVLLEVFARDKWRERNIEVSLFGAGAGEQSLRQLAGRMKITKVHFRGHVADVKEIWNEHQMLILPSRYEGLPLALVEAMFCARPALVTDAGGNIEMCADGETGFVAPAPTAALLDQTLERAWNQRDAWRMMGERARARAEKVFPNDPVGDFCRQLTGCVKGGA